MKNQNKLLLAFIALLAVSGCSDVKKDLGIARNSPDEFTVVKRAPLTLPPEYSLVPPINKNDVTDETLAKTTSEKAKKTLLGNSNTNNAITTSDQVFLQKLDVISAEENIRQKIDEDNGYIAIENQGLIEKLTSKDEDITTTDYDEPTVDAKAEAKRIKDNLENDKAINEGDVPVIEKKKGTLDKLMDTF